MTIAFAGHSLILSFDKIKDLVKNEIKNNISGEDKVLCLLGGYGDFDEICARACRELKKEYDFIETVYVPPYITLSEQKKIKEMQAFGLYDTSIYPPIENVPPKFAIAKRNEWMMTNADLVIAYVSQKHGGAYRSLQIAKRKEKKIINLFAASVFEQ